MASRVASNAGKSEADVIVVGGGGAGLSAALEAAERGGRVVVIEKRGILGGNTSMASVLFGAETPFQKRMGIGIPKDLAFKLAMGYAHWKIDPRLVRAFIDKTAETTEWLEEKGVVFEDIPNYFPSQKPRVFQFMKGHGAALTRALARHCKRLGVEFLYETSAKRILTNRKKEITGVLAATKDGEVKVPGRSVIIATGGFGGNREMMKKYCPTYSDDMILFGMPISVGDGLRLATGAGAAVEGLGVLQTIGPRFAGSPYIAAIVVEPDTVWINTKGERFVDESLSFRWPEAGNALSRQPGRVCYNLFDEKIKKSLMTEGIKRGFKAFLTGTKMTKLDKEIKANMAGGEIFVSDSLEEIGRLMGLEPGSLPATIEEYNRFCDQGRDAVFAKDPQYLLPLRTPPFYAIKCHQSLHGTVGGIKINYRMEVLDKGDEPISGLYAAGTDTGGWEGDTYCLELSGSMFAFAISSGRIAGENALTYASAGQTQAVS